MGIYAFETERSMTSFAATPPTRNRATISARTSFPALVRNGKASRAPLHRQLASDQRPKQSAYWRDVGTVDAYWEANIDLTDLLPRRSISMTAPGRSGPMRRSPRRPSSCMTSTPARPGDIFAGLRRLHNLRNSVSDKSLLFTGVCTHSYGQFDACCGTPLCHDWTACLGCTAW